MSAAEALRAARAVGITVRSDDECLLLEADVDPEGIRRALSRDNRGNANGPLRKITRVPLRPRGSWSFAQDGNCKIRPGTQSGTGRWSRLRR
jgi:hypothetical protein